MDSDTKVALLSGAPFDDPTWWLLSNEQIRDARAAINNIAGTKRMFSHSVFTPGQEGWMDEVDKAIAEYKPDSWKGYTVGDPLSPDHQGHRLAPRRREAGVSVLREGGQVGHQEHLHPQGPVAAGLRAVLARGMEARHRGRCAQGRERLAAAQLHHVPRCAAPVPRRSAVRAGSVREDRRDPLGHRRRRDPAKARRARTSTANWAPRSPPVPWPTRAWRLPWSAQLVNGMGADHVVWGTDSVWYGSPQWQIEAMRRLEIPDDMMKKHGWKTKLGGCGQPSQGHDLRDELGQAVQLQDRRPSTRICRATSWRR